ncbi:unnamed protein product [Rotaria sordida]|uniref:Uncharacterized protein n=2 Tax=Rotaria sordida TaxID=392033 RepID=A0A819QG10_9BILA|nr:unnamed protein product [Rotaria sordida]
MEYEGALKLGRISIGNRLHPVTVYQPANKMTFCTNCWLIGHTRATCSVRERKCRICLMVYDQDHTNTCSGKPLCAQCGQDHHSLDPKCEFIQQYRKKLNLEVKQAVNDGIINRKSIQVHQQHQFQIVGTTYAMDFPALSNYNNNIKSKENKVWPDIKSQRTTTNNTFSNDIIINMLHKMNNELKQDMKSMKDMIVKKLDEQVMLNAKNIQLHQVSLCTINTALMKLIKNVLYPLIDIIPDAHVQVRKQISSALIDLEGPLRIHAEQVRINFNADYNSSTTRSMVLSTNGLNNKEVVAPSASSSNTPTLIEEMEKSTREWYESSSLDQTLSLWESDNTNCRPSNLSTYSIPLNICAYNVNGCKNRATEFSNSASSKPALTLDEFFNYTEFSSLTLSLDDGQSILIQTRHHIWDRNVNEEHLHLQTLRGENRKLITTQETRFKPQWKVVIKASHFNGGTITWSPVDPYTNSSSVVITIIQSYSWVLSKVDCKTDVPISTSSRSTENRNLTCLANCLNQGNYSDYPIDILTDCVSSSSSMNVMTSQRSKNVTLDTGAYFSIAYQFANWRSLDNSISGSWSIVCGIDLRRRPDGIFNTPPVSNVASPQYVIVNRTTQIKIPVSDVNREDDVRCRWSQNPGSHSVDECAGVCYSNLMPSGTNLSNCVLTFTATTANTWYAVALQIEDFLNTTSTTAMSSVPVQFLINVLPLPSCSALPVILPLTDCLVVQPNISVNFTLYAINYCNTTQTIIADISLTKQISGMNNSGLFNSSTNESLSYITLTWTPTSNQIGLQQFCAIAYTNENVQSDEYCAIFNVTSSNSLCLTSTTATARRRRQRYTNQDKIKRREPLSIMSKDIRTKPFSLVQNQSNTKGRTLSPPLHNQAESVLISANNNKKIQSIRVAKLFQVEKPLEQRNFSAYRWGSNEAICTAKKSLKLPSSDISVYSSSTISILANTKQPEQTNPNIRSNIFSASNDIQLINDICNINNGQRKTSNNSHANHERKRPTTISTATVHKVNKKKKSKKKSNQINCKFYLNEITN